MLSSFIASPNAKNWAKIQIYESLLSILMLIIFGSFTYLFFFNPQAPYQSLGLVPGNSGLLGFPNCQDSTTYNNVFTLSLCDLKFFNAAAYNVGEELMFVPIVLGMVPGLLISININFFGISMGFSNLQLVPPSITSVFDRFLQVFLSLMVLNQVQVLLVASSLLFLSLFVTLGLIARTLGFTRTFGGAMIALGLGLGLVYPMLVSITYGFVDYQMGQLSFLNGGSFVGVLLGALLSMLTTSVLSSSIISLFTGICYLVAGLTFLPFLNFLILDTFIIDLSSALGEKIDFMSLLTGLV